MSSKTEDAAAAAAAAAEMDELGKRKFFPRVKHLIGNKEWEDFLNGILDAIEAAGAPHAAAASHKASNAWYKAFDLVYGGVASDYSIPTGKNRYHKFKDKIVEVWCALEQDAPADHPCRGKAMAQLDTYRQACAEVNKPAVGSSSAVGTPKAVRTSTGGGTATKPSVISSATAKRGFAGPPSGVLYKNIDEVKIIATLPEPLQSLLHLRQLQREMAATTAVRITKKNLEDHSRKVDTAYLDALNEFAGPLDDEDEKKPDEPLDKDEAFARAQALAVLYRYANPGMEQRTLSEAYQKAVDQYVTHVCPSAMEEHSISV
ncbi:hypothetical protein IV203_034563 [Nitzschia inconspicua]|uniref:Uncharacterized protein n=1 Tax=Nitzschia inconspicua TaxID=303405 RepID=A0A9K3LBL9_9STRA|nr:hypothetical protein IV203_034563 [Nitzschia inconspicua]